MPTTEPAVIRYHTAGRRQPQLIGKDPSGMPIWGGPYTLYQVAGLAAIPIMWKTRAVWAGQLSGIAVIAVIAMTTTAVIWLLGRINFAGRNIIYATVALLTAWTRTLQRGPHRPRRGRPGHKVGGVVVCGRTVPGRPAPTPGGRQQPTRADRPTGAEPAPQLTGPTRPPAPTPTGTGEPDSVQSAAVVQVPDPQPPTMSAADRPAPGPRLSPLESFLAAADKIKVDAP